MARLPIPQATFPIKVRPPLANGSPHWKTRPDPRQNSSSLTPAQKVAWGFENLRLQISPPKIRLAFPRCYYY
jgi:hypothetical protein